MGQKASYFVQVIKFALPSQDAADILAITWSRLCCAITPLKGRDTRQKKLPPDNFQRTNFQRTNFQRTNFQRTIDYRTQTNGSQTLS